MRKLTHDLVPPEVESVPVPQPQLPQRSALRGTELRRPPAAHSIRASQQTRHLRSLPRRRSY
ncbi:hypothetical protein [Nonomuraea insulae]|uniref:Uncharacterized protein n=1 Tax=Nonomuraea insulae TaxID=1616787 RepID=A0ABW1CNX7_9ACTN